MGNVRRVCTHDKEYVLKYCANTFGWGDYIHYVWNDWILNGEFLAYECDVSLSSQSPSQSSSRPSHTMRPVGICHVHTSDGQIWIEGVRVHPQYRRHGIATTLVKTAEDAALLNARQLRGDDYSLASYMLIDTKNTSSLVMGSMLGYCKTHTWTYYKLEPRLYPSSETRAVAIADNDFHDNFDCTVYSHYVDSWRWFQTNPAMLKKLASQNLIAITAESYDVTRDVLDKNSRSLTVSINVISQSVEGQGATLYATLYPGTNAKVMIKYLSDVAARCACESACIFVPQHDQLPVCEGLVKSHSFHIVKKPLSY